MTVGTKARAALGLLRTGARLGPSMVAALDAATVSAFGLRHEGIVTWDRLGPAARAVVVRWVYAQR